jgi:hypothetical protein
MLSRTTRRVLYIPAARSGMRVENIQKYFDQFQLYFKKEVKMYSRETDSEQGRLDPGTLSRSPPAWEKIHRPDQFGTGRAERAGPGGRARYEHAAGQ